MILFLSVLLGGALAFYLRKNNERYLKSALSFGGAFVLGITLLHLMPEVYSGHDHAIGLYIIAGFLLQLALEQLSQGVEHGHIHAGHQMRTSFALQIMFGLCVHAFLEGMPLAAGGHGDVLYYGVLVHKTPAAFALVLVLLLSQFNDRTVWLCLLAFAAMSPLGALFTRWLAQNDWLTPNFQRPLLALVVGSFLHIATTILFELENRSHHIAASKLVAILLGIGASLLTIL